MTQKISENGLFINSIRREYVTIVMQQYYKQFEGIEDEENFLSDYDV